MGLPPADGEPGRVVVLSPVAGVTDMEHVLQTRGGVHPHPGHSCGCSKVRGMPGPENSREHKDALVW